MSAVDVRRIQRPGLLWSVGFALTSGAGWLINAAPARLDHHGVVPALSLFGVFVLLAALVASIPQALLLRLYVRGARSWIPYSATGALVGYAFLYPGVWLGTATVLCPHHDSLWGGVEDCSPNQYFIRDLLAFFFSGAAFGSVQMLVLRRWVRHAFLCIPLSAFALSVAGTVFPLRYLPMDFYGCFWRLLISGAAGGLIKGIGLMYLLSDHLREDPLLAEAAG